MSKKHKTQEVEEEPIEETQEAEAEIAQEANKSVLEQAQEFSEKKRKIEEERANEKSSSSKSTPRDTTLMDEFKGKLISEFNLEVSVPLSRKTNLPKHEGCVLKYNKKFIMSLIVPRKGNELFKTFREDYEHNKTKHFFKVLNQEDIDREYNAVAQWFSSRNIEKKTE